MAWLFGYSDQLSSGILKTIKRMSESGFEKEGQSGNHRKMINRRSGTISDVLELKDKCVN